MPRRKKPSRNNSKKKQRKSNKRILVKGDNSNRKKLYEIEKIYNGNDGPIILVEDDDGKEFVLKRYDVEQSDKGVDSSLLLEIMILQHMKKIKSKYIVIIDHVTFTKSAVDIVVEKMNGELTELIHASPIISQTKNYLKQILAGLYDLHSNGIIHCDLKPKNILYTYQNNKTILKIIDFGLSYLINFPYYHARSIVGTHHYHPPEYRNHRSVGRITFNSDIYSLGIIFYYMINSKDYLQYDYNKNYEYMFNINQVDWNFVIKKVGQDGHDLLRQMLEIDPEKRISTIRALNHPFLNNTEDTEDTEKTKNKKQDGGRIWEITNLTSTNEYLYPTNHEEFIPIIISNCLKTKFEVDPKQQIPLYIWNLMYESFESLELKFITLNYAICLMYKYLSVKRIRQDNWEHLAYACLFLSTKFNEYRLDVNITKYNIDNRKLILKLEKEIIMALDYSFPIPILITKEVILYQYFFDVLYKRKYIDIEFKKSPIILNTYHQYYLLQLLSSITYFTTELYQENKDDLSRMIISFIFPFVKHKTNLKNNLINMLKSKRQIYWIETELLEYLNI